MEFNPSKYKVSLTVCHKQKKACTQHYYKMHACKRCYSIEVPCRDNHTEDFHGNQMYRYCRLATANSVKYILLQNFSTCSRDITKV